MNLLSLNLNGTDAGLGVEFLNVEDAYKARMVEQAVVSKHQGRPLPVRCSLV